MPGEQMTLDLFGEQAARQQYVARHQIGHYRTPWTWATGPTPGAPTPQAGDLVPAWRCCHCGAIEMTEYALRNEHDCCRTWTMPSCYYHPGGTVHRYRMDDYWIPPDGWTPPAPVRPVETIEIPGVSR